LNVGGLGTGQRSSSYTTKLVTDQAGGNRRTGAWVLPSTERILKIPMFYKIDKSLSAIFGDNSGAMSLAYAPAAVAYAASSPFLLATIQLSQTCDNCFLAIRATIVLMATR
jgi:hypothetical protein